VTGDKRLYFIEPEMHVVKHNAIGQNILTHLRYLLIDQLNMSWCILLLI